MSNPTDVLEDVVGMEWTPEPVADVIQKSIEALRNCPDEINVAITLNGVAAQRYNFIKTLVQSMGVPEAEVSRYLLQAGVEREIARLAIASAVKE